MALRAGWVKISVETVQVTSGFIVLPCSTRFYPLWGRCFWASHPPPTLRFTVRLPTTEEAQTPRLRQVVAREVFPDPQARMSHEADQDLGGLMVQAEAARE